VINQKCIRDGKIDMTLCKHTSPEQNIKPEKYAKKGDILVNSTGTGTLGRVAIYRGENMFPVDGHVTILHVKNENSSFFLGYYLHSIEPLIENLGRGSTNQMELSVRDLGRIKIFLPNYDTQKKVAGIISAYDELIENNQKRITLLEIIAQELYKEWFVRFRFPGHETTEFENGLPVGWYYGRFNEYLKYVTGKLDSNAACESGPYSFYTCSKKILKTNTFCFDGECVLLGGNNATGDFPLFYANEKLDAYQRTYIITPSNSRLNCMYVFFILKDYLRHFKTASIGATTKFLTKQILDRVKILIPGLKIMALYNKITRPMFDLMVNLNKQNEKLMLQRDLLLPRLMNGSLEV